MYISNLSKFADYTKCYKVIHNFQDSQSLQLNVDSLFQWSLENKLSFNINKCVVVQLKPYINTNFIRLIVSIIESYPRSQNIVI